MRSDFPSINDIFKKDGSEAPMSGASLANKKTSSTSEVFTKKMEEIGLKEKEIMTAERAALVGLPYIDLSSFPVSSEALKAIPQDTAETLGIVCFYFTPDQIRLGITDLHPEIEELVAEMGDRHHAEIRLYMISQHSFERVLRLYANLPIVKPITKDVIITDEEIDRYEVGLNNLQSLQQAFTQVSISDILTLMIASALKVNSSDIHVEAEEAGITVRYRIDGVLHDVAKLPKEQWKRFVSRIKLLAALKLNITDRPQDGRVTLRLSSGGLDIRVSTLPTIHGESVVMRILHSGNKGVTFDDLGLRGSAYERLKHEIDRPNGMIITTGPTGSGKTTTLYAILRTLNKPGVKIITLEDPIEIKMDGINQSQVDPSRDYTFAKGLRSLLRQDPDICMVGEIRDLETAEISIQAALTGHLMLSTLHTNNAAASIPRLLSMGVEPYLLSPSLNSIIGQRLVRRICTACIVEDVVTPEKMERVVEFLEKLPPQEKTSVDMTHLRFFKGAGCDVCSGLGYKGRIGIYEIMILTKEMEQSILSNSLSEYTIQELAVKNGMVTMVQDGILKALDKITTIDEVFRVTE